LNLIARCRDSIMEDCEPNISSMKIALLALLGLVLGTLGGAALGIGLGLAWIEIFKTTDFEGYSGMLVFFSFMPAGAMIGGLGCAFIFGLLAFRDNEIAIEREQQQQRELPHLAELIPDDRIRALQNCALHYGPAILFVYKRMLQQRSQARRE
jgi:hypothetical protein